MNITDIHEFININLLIVTLILIAILKLFRFVIINFVLRINE